MSDYASIIAYLTDSKEAWEQKDYVRAAISAYWCIQYCKNGEPYGISSSTLLRSESESWNIYRKSSSKLEESVLSKTTYLYGTICPKLLWLYKNKYNLRIIPPETQKKFDKGHNIGNLAQKLFPNGVNASQFEGNETEKIIDMTKIELPFKIKQQLWIDKTKELCNEHTVYEAAFISDEVFAAVDILTKSKNGYIAYEVKSSTAITDVFIKDCALQYHVINTISPLEDFFLIYLNGPYLDEIQIPLDKISESNADINKLFIKESMLSKILHLQKEVAEDVKTCKSILKKGEPKIGMGTHCCSPYDCMYKQYCKGSKEIEFDIW